MWPHAAGGTPAGPPGGLFDLPPGVWPLDQSTLEGGCSDAQLPTPGHMSDLVDSFALAPVLAAQQAQVNILNSKIQKLERSRGQILKDLTDMLKEAREARQKLYSNTNEEGSASDMDGEACEPAPPDDDDAAPRLARRSGRMKTAPELGRGPFAPPPGLDMPNPKGKGAGAGPGPGPADKPKPAPSFPSPDAPPSAKAPPPPPPATPASTVVATGGATAAAAAAAPKTAPKTAPTTAATATTASPSVSAHVPSSSGRQAVQPDGLVVKEKDLEDGVAARVEWRIDNAKNKFKDYIGRHLVSPFFKAAGLKELRLMVAPECGDIAGRTVRELRSKFDEQLAEGPLQGHVKLKVVTDSEKRLSIRFKTFVGDVSTDPLEHDFTEHVVHSARFSTNWLEQMKGGSLSVGVEILSVESEAA